MGDRIPGTVYLLHFEKPIGNMEKNVGRAQHYVGWTEDIEVRLAQHLLGQGARIVAAVVAKGIGVKLARVWTHRTRYFERKLKKSRNAPRYCPECRKVVQNPPAHWPK